MLRRSIIALGGAALLALVVAAPVLEGGGPILVGIALVVALFAAARLLFVREKLRFPLLPFVLLGLFIAYGAIQATPLPQKVVAKISPERMRLERESLDGLAQPDDGPRAISIQPRRTSQQAWRWLIAGIAMLGAAMWIRRRRDARTLMTVMALAAGAEALYGMVNGSGTFVNRNHFGGLMALGFFCALGVLVDRASRLHVPKFPSLRPRIAAAMDSPGFWKTLIAGALLVLVGLGLVISLSRGAVIGTAGGILIYLALSRRSLAFGGAFIGLAVAAVWLGLGPLQHRFETLGAPEGPGTYYDLFRMALKVHEAFPAGGAGLGTYKAATASMWSPHMGAGFALVAHNDYLDILAGAGWIGAPLLVGTILAILILAFRRAKSPKSVALLCALAAMTAAANANFNLQLPGNAVWYFAIAGTALSPAFGRSRGVNGLPLGVFLVILVAIATPAILREDRYDAIEALRRETELGGAPPRVMDASVHPLAAGRFQRLRGEPCEPSLVEAISIEPASAAPLLEIGWSAVAAGDEKRAERCFRLARKRDAADPWVLSNCYQYWIARKDFDELAATAAALLWSSQRDPDPLFEELVLATGSLDFLGRLLPEGPTRPKWEKEITRFINQRVR